MRIFKYLMLLFTTSLLFSCDPPEPDIPDRSKDFIGTWYGRETSSVGLSSWYEFTFNDDGSGSFTQERSFTNYYCAFQWKCNGNKVRCSGFIASDDEDGEVSAWQDELTLKDDGKLYSSKYTKVGGLKKLGKSYPDDDKEDNNGSDNSADENKPKLQFEPYLKVSSSTQYSSNSGEYLAYASIQYGGANMTSSEIYEVGVTVEVINGRSETQIYKDSRQNVNVGDDLSRYWEWKFGVYGSRSVVPKISVKEFWRFKGETTVHYGQPVVLQLPYDSNLDKYGADDPEKPVQPGTSGSLNGHRWVDLGLSVKWADRNVGSTSPSDVGELFIWDEAADAAKTWGDGWRLPTYYEMKELQSLFDFKYNMLYNEWPAAAQKFWTTMNGVQGAKLWGTTGQTIFLPVKSNSKSYYYWTSYASSEYGSGAHAGCFSSDFHWDVYYEYNEMMLNPIRLVCK